MKQWEDIFKDHLEDYEMKLPASDRDAFLNRKATRERFARRRRNVLSIAVGLPAAAAILCAVLLSVHLLKPSEPITKVGGIDPALFGLPDTFGDSQIIYGLDKADITPGVKALPVSAGDTVTGLITRWDESEIKPFKGVSVEEFDKSGRTAAHTFTDENGYFSLRINNLADSILVHADGYEPIKFRPFRLDGQIASFLLSEIDIVCMVVSDQPEFPGGTGALQNYIKSNIEYPADARKDSIKGRVLVQFIVEKDGSLSNIEVLKHVHPLLDAEAIRIVSNMPRWKPGKDFGFPRRVQYTIPVNFRLD